MPLIDYDSVQPVEMLPGVLRRTMTAGDRMMLVEVRSHEEEPAEEEMTEATNQ